jgi:ribosomal protein S6
MNWNRGFYLRHRSRKGEANMTNAKLKTYLKSVKACVESIEWLGERDLATAWAECDRADWMLDR